MRLLRHIHKRQSHDGMNKSHLQTRNKMNKAKKQGSSRSSLFCSLRSISPIPKLFFFNGEQVALLQTRSRRSLGKSLLK